MVRSKVPMPEHLLEVVNTTCGLGPHYSCKRTLANVAALMAEPEAVMEEAEAARGRRLARKVTATLAVKEALRAEHAEPVKEDATRWRSQWSQNQSCSVQNQSCSVRTCSST